MNPNIIGDTLPKKKRLEKVFKIKTISQGSIDRLLDGLANERAKILAQEIDNKKFKNWLQRWKIKNAIKHLERLKKQYE